MKFYLSILIFLVSSITFANENPMVKLKNQECSTQNSIRVSISVKGDITVNGKSSSLDNFKIELDRNDKSVKEVCYNRESPEQFEPHPNALKILDLVIAKELPISMYWDKNFKKRIQFGS